MLTEAGVSDVEDKQVLRDTYNTTVVIISITTYL
jgi:hypothetical protein